LSESQILFQLKKEKARRNFWYFCLFLDTDFFNKRIFLKEIADGLQKIQDKEINSFSASLPPRAGKSYSLSLFCTWWLGHNPTKCVMRNTVTATLYNKFSYAVRDIIRSEKYKEVFPQIELSPDKQNINCWALKTSTQDAYFGGGVGTNIIGSGANLAITDDLFSGYKDATSEVYLDTLELWKQGSHDSRKEKGCPEIDIGTRWSIKDVIGKGIENGKYDISIVQPALIENEKGEWISFCEDVKTTAEYLKIKRDILPELFEGEYQQNPVELKGILFPRKLLKRFSLKSLKESEELQRKENKLPEQNKLGYWDVADTGTDNLAAAIGQVYEKKVLITDVIFSDAGVGITRPLSVALLKKTKPSFIRIESNSQGSVFATWLLQESLPNTQIQTMFNTSKKQTRIFMQSAFILEHFYFLNEDEIIEGSDYDKFMRELCSYLKNGESKHDDAPDCIAGLAQLISESLPHLFV